MKFKFQNPFYMKKKIYSCLIPHKQIKDPPFLKIFKSRPNNLILSLGGRYVCVEEGGSIK